VTKQLNAKTPNSPVDLDAHGDGSSFWDPLFGLHIRDTLSKKMTKVPEAGVSFAASSKAVLSAKGVQLRVVGTVEDKDIMHSGSTHMSPSGSLLSFLLMPLSCLNIALEMEIEESYLLGLWALAAPVALKKHMDEELQNPLFCH